MATIPHKGTVTTVKVDLNTYATVDLVSLGLVRRLGLRPSRQLPPNLFLVDSLEIEKRGIYEIAFDLRDDNG